jgi:hypothetical protein
VHQNFLGERKACFFENYPKICQYNQLRFCLHFVCKYSMERRMHVYKFFAAFVRSFPYPISFRALLGGVGAGAQTMRAAD